MADYTLNCVDCGFATCWTAGFACYYTGDPTCLPQVTGGCGKPCPDAKSHSHLVTDNCHMGTCEPAIIDCMQCILAWLECQPLSMCVGSPTGSCDYDCDEGYEWDGEACVLIPPPPPPPAKPLISKPLINPILVNPSIIRQVIRFSKLNPLVT